MTKKKSEHKKKVAKKKHTAKTHHVTSHHESDIHIEKVLVENFVALQKVMTNLSVKFDNLSGQISKLLDLFEVSAKAMAQKDFALGGKDDDEMLSKINSLLEQNKVIARGITLLHEPNSSGASMPNTSTSPRPPVRPRMPPPNQMRSPIQNQFQMASPQYQGNRESYQKSLHIDETTDSNFDIGRNEKSPEDKSGF